MDMQKCDWCGGLYRYGHGINVTTGWFGKDAIVCCERCKIEWLAANKK